MGKIEDDIELEVMRIREHIKGEPLRIVLTSDKRCFAPCGIGHCNCVATVGERYCIVTESSFRSACDDINRSIQYLEEQLSKAERKIEYGE